MSSFFSIGGRRGGQSDDRSDSNNHLGGDGEDVPHVPPREISFWYDRADHHTHGGFVEPCHQQQQQLDLYSYSPSRMRRSTRSMDGADSSGMMMAGGYGGGGICCQECGNGAKKECVHQRCRTCCQSRGFDCPTHVKSTWVPAWKRRERQQQQLQQQQQQQLQLSSSHQVLAKRRQPDDPAGASSTSLACVSRGRSGLEAGNFPAEVNSPAMFRCVCVSSFDEGEDHDQYAYQTAVNIGGRLFKGILYDQGPDHSGGDVAAGDSSSGGGSGGVTQPLRLGGHAESGSSAPAALIEPYSSSLYPSSFNFYNTAGTQFFPHPRS